MTQDQKIKERVEAVCRRMSLLEKCALLTGEGEFNTRGYERYGVPEVNVSDGPHGLRHQGKTGNHLGIGGSDPATCFPTASILACSWDPDLAEEVGAALGAEAKRLDVQVLLGPGLNMKRSPLCGRNFEYFSEDPVLAGRMAAGMVRGIQSQGVGACPKHFAVNSQESRRQAVDSVVDEKTLREIYLTGFEIVVKESHPLSIMSSYNMVNGTYANENGHLLTDILRSEWGFDGAVITDWGGSNDHTEGVKAGSSLEMPPAGGDSIRELMRSVAQGRLDEEDIDARVVEVLTLAFRTETGGMQKEKQEEGWVGSHHELAHRAAQESLVLLKNDGLLPLKKDQSAAIIGDMAAAFRFQGAGSSQVTAVRTEGILSAAQKSGLAISGFEQGYRCGGDRDEDLLSAAKKLAAKSDVVLFFMGLPEEKESEGLDRPDQKIPQEQIDALLQVAEVNPHIVAVLEGGASMETDWSIHAESILYSGLPGQAGSLAIFDVISGRVNPSGKLAETWGRHLSDYPVTEEFPSKGRESVYREGPFIGYRHFLTKNIPVAFPFGYGLSYTTFSYSGLNVDEKRQCVTFTITNTGSAVGKETAQLYIRKKDRICAPDRELKGFVKVQLKPGESCEACIPFDEYTFRFFDPADEAWKIEAGEYEILVGASSDDIRLTKAYRVDGAQRAMFGLPIVDSDTSAENAKAFYDKIPEQKKRIIDQNITFGELKYSKSPILIAISLVIGWILKASARKGTPGLNILFIYNMPLRALAKMSEGFFSMEAVHGLVLEAKGFWLIGLIWTIIALIANGVENAVTNRQLKKCEQG